MAYEGNVAATTDGTGLEAKTLENACAKVVSSDDTFVGSSPKIICEVLIKSFLKRKNAAEDSAERHTSSPGVGDFVLFDEAKYGAAAVTPNRSTSDVRMSGGVSLFAIPPKGRRGEGRTLARIPRD